MRGIEAKFMDLVSKHIAKDILPEFVDAVTTGKSGTRQRIAKLWGLVILGGSFVAALAMGRALAYRHQVQFAHCNAQDRNCRDAHLLCSPQKQRAMDRPCASRPLRMHSLGTCLVKNKTLNLHLFHCESV